MKAETKEKRRIAAVVKKRERDDRNSGEGRRKGSVEDGDGDLRLGRPAAAEEREGGKGAKVGSEERGRERDNHVLILWGLRSHRTGRLRLIAAEIGRGGEV